MDHAWIQRKRKKGLIRTFSWYCSGKSSTMTQENLVKYPTACDYIQFINLLFSPIPLYSVINAFLLHNCWNGWLNFSKAKVILSNLVLWKNQSWHSYTSWLKRKRNVIPERPSANSRTTIFAWFSFSFSLDGGRSNEGGYRKTEYIRVL